MFIKAIPSKSCADCVFDHDVTNCLARVAIDSRCQRQPIAWAEATAADGTLHVVERRTRRQPPHSACPLSNKPVALVACRGRA